MKKFDSELKNQKYLVGAALRTIVWVYEKIILCTQRRSTNISSASKPFSHDELYEEESLQAIAWNHESR